jgi:hypothetical protein
LHREIELVYGAQPAEGHRQAGRLEQRHCGRGARRGRSVGYFTTTVLICWKAGPLT